MVQEKDMAVAERHNASARVGGNVVILPVRGGRMCEGTRLRGLKTHGYVRSSLRDGGTRPSGPVDTEHGRCPNTENITHTDPRYRPNGTNVESPG